MESTAHSIHCSGGTSGSHEAAQGEHCILHCEPQLVLGTHGSGSLCRDGQENKMAAAYNVLASKRRYFTW